MITSLLTLTSIYDLILMYASQYLCLCLGLDLDLGPIVVLVEVEVGRDWERVAE